MDSIYLPVFHVPFVGRDANWRTHLWSLRSLGDLAASCDVVYAAWLYPDAVAAVRLAREFGKPCWIMVQGSDTFNLKCRGRRRAILDACRAASGIVCVWQGLKERLVSAGIPENKVHVVPNGVDTSLFCRRSREEALARLSSVEKRLLKEDGTCGLLPAVRDRTARMVLFVGNLVPVKGPDILLAACSDVMRRIDSRLTLVVVGDGFMRRSLERYARRLGLGDSVFFAGNCSHANVALWMNVADVLCLSSRSEGMPNVVLEALASGLPVAATDAGACREMLQNEPHARVVSACEREETTVRGLADALVQLLSVPADREEMARRHQTLRSWDKQAGTILKLMETTTVR